MDQWFYTGYSRLSSDLLPNLAKFVFMFFVTKHPKTVTIQTQSILNNLKFSHSPCEILNILLQLSKVILDMRYSVLTNRAWIVHDN